MAAIVCHGLQSCMESQLVESRIHRLRLPSPKPKPLTSPPQPIVLPFKSCTWEPNAKPHCGEEHYHKTDTAHNNPNPTQCGGGWSFIQALSDVSKEALDKETTYVHPQVKQSSLRMSPKSLELCTENLGDETGTDILEGAIDLLSSTSGTREQRKSRQLLGDNKKTKPRNFPPPLTTIRGSESLQVRPHREDGRLVIEVIKAPSATSCFHAERSNGRLRLCVLENLTTSFDPEPEEDDNEGIEGEFEGEMNEQRQDVEEGGDEEEEDEKEEEKTEEGAEEVESGDGERDAYMEKYEIERERRRRRSRCKEEGGEHENNELLMKWGKSLWVATS